jgi:hypothetical protein
MPFVLRPFRRSPVQCAVTFNAGPFQGQGTVWNLSLNGVETLGRCSAASWADVFLDRQFAEPTKNRCGCSNRALGPGPGVRPGNLGG